MKKLKQLLLSNQGTKQTLVKNSLWLSLVEMISKVIMFVVTVSVVRYFGATEFGRLNYAQSFVGIVMLLSDFGLNTILIRDIAKDKKHVANYLMSASVVRGVSTLLVLLTLAIVTPLLGSTKGDASLFLLMGAFLLAQSLENLYTSVLSAYESMEFIFVSRVVHYLGILLSVGVVIVFHLNLHGLLIAYTVSALLSVLISLWFLHRLKVQLQAPFNIQLTWRLLKESLPIFGMLAINQVYLNLDTVLIRLDVGTTAVGYYQAAYKILFAFQAINLITTATFPRIATLYHEGHFKQLRKLAKLVIGGSSLFLIPFIGVIAYMSPFIITRIYGITYLPAAPVLPLLLTAGLLMFYRTFIANFFLAGGRQNTVFYISLFGLIVNAVCNYFLIPRFGFVQAGTSMVIAEACMTIVSLVLLGQLGGLYESKFTK